MIGSIDFCVGALLFTVWLFSNAYVMLDVCKHGSEQAAVRELREETGYVGTAVSTAGPLVMSPGLSDETAAWRSVSPRVFFEVLSAFGMVSCTFEGFCGVKERSKSYCQEPASGCEVLYSFVR